MDDGMPEVERRGSAHDGGPAVLFDLDGTLIATKALYLECYRRALEPQLGRALSDRDIMDLKPRAELRFLPGLAERAEHCLDEFYRHYEALHDELFEGIYEGVPAMLERLRRAGVPLGVVTGKSRRAGSITLARVELGEFDVLVWDDDVDSPKPDPTGVRRGLDALGAAPDRAWYIGDTFGDILAARAAGARAGAVLWSKSEAERDDFARYARAEGAEVFAAPAELVDAVLAT